MSVGLWHGAEVGLGYVFLLLLLPGSSGSSCLPEGATEPFSLPGWLSWPSLLADNFTINFTEKSDDREAASWPSFMHTHPGSPPSCPLSWQASACQLLPSRGPCSVDSLLPAGGGLSVSAHPRVICAQALLSPVFVTLSIPSPNITLQLLSFIARLEKAPQSLSPFLLRKGRRKAQVLLCVSVCP